MIACDIIQFSTKLISVCFIQVLMELAEIYPAVESAKRAIHLKPDWAEGYQTLGRSMLNTGQLILVSNRNGHDTFDLKIRKLLSVDNLFRR